jgi:Rhodopirellula transposase DDE domain
MGVAAVVTQEMVAAKLGEILPHLDERQRRLLMGAEARALGHGGIRLVARAAGVREETVSRGVAELDAGEEPLGRARRPGGGRKRAAVTDPGLVPALLALVEPEERGDPMSPLRWTTKSLRHLAAELTAQGHPVSPGVVGELLRGQGFSLQGNSRVSEGAQHPDRDGQFRYLNERAREHMAAGEPVISVDAKKKELVGDFANGGREWRPRGDPARVRDHDFMDEELGRVIPYGVYDLAANAGWVLVGTDHDTAAFAVESVRRWWQAMGREAYPAATRLLVTADAGGSNSYRNRAWKAGLHAFALETGLTITVCHFPPGTSKWNKIEHRLFSHVTMNWRGRPLASHDVIVSVIAATTTRTGLRVRAQLDPGAYPTGAEVPDAQMAALPLDRHDWHGDWNYALRPEPPAPRPPARPARPAPPRAGQDALAALAGLTPDQLTALAAALELPWNAQKEATLYQQRGGPRRHHAGYPSRLGLTDHILATLLHHHLSLRQDAIGHLLGINQAVISHAIRLTRPLLTQHGITLKPIPRRTRTLDDITRHATQVGISLQLKPAC